MLHERVNLKRDVEAVQIPSGQKITLPAHMPVTITQSLGGSYTVITEGGTLARISGEDADALNKEVQAGSQGPSESEATQESVEKLVWDQLKTCFDPEIPVNIVDLGLVYKCEVASSPDGGFAVNIEMTLTAPGCGMGPVIAMEAEGKVRKVPGVKSAAVNVVFDPPWDQSMMSEAAKLQLGFF
jgi:probable FeS assembly SUF system protein SufT